MRRLLILLTVVMAACSVNPAPAPAPNPVGHPIRHSAGLNGAFHARLDSLTLDHLATWGVMTLRAPVLNDAQAQDIIDSIKPYGGAIRVLLLVETKNLDIVQQIALIAAANPQWVVGVELGNELDLGNVSPEDFGLFVFQGQQLLRDAGYTGLILSGGIYSVQPESLDYLKQAMLVGRWPLDIAIAIHRYGDPNAGQQGYRDRQWETDAIQVVAQGHAIRVTEFGYPTPATVDEQWAAQAICVDRQWFAQLDADADYYQLTSGPSTSNLDSYGLLTVHQDRWKAFEPSLLPGGCS